VRNINVSNTTVNTTVINNVYNTIVIKQEDRGYTYVNRAVPGAVTRRARRHLRRAAGGRNLIKVDQRALGRRASTCLAPL